MEQDGTLGNFQPVRPLQVNDLLKKLQGYVWYQYEIYLVENSLVGPFPFVTTGRNKLKYPSMIYYKQWKGLEKKGRKKGINTSYNKEVLSLRR